MSTEENKALVRRLMEEGYNQGNWSLFDELLASNYVNHDPTNPTVSDREGLKQLHMGFHAIFPDYHVTIDDLIAEGDRVSKRWTWGGTQTGEFQGIPPTGKKVTISGITNYRVANSKVQECWWAPDLFGLLQQLGVIPQPEAAQV